jgi:hypothetical protein
MALHRLVAMAQLLEAPALVPVREAAQAVVRALLRLLALADQLALELLPVVYPALLPLAVQATCKAQLSPWDFCLWSPWLLCKGFSNVFKIGVLKCDSLQFGFE